MDARTRQDLVTLSLSPGRVASETFESAVWLSEDPTISMLLKPQRRVETGDFPEDLEIFDPESGEDEQITLFNYEYHSRGIPSETPRTARCAADHKVDLTVRFQGLAMEDSDEEPEADNYTFSPKFFTTGNGVDRGESFSLPETGLFRETEAKYCFNSSEASRNKISLDPPSSASHALATELALLDLDKSRTQLSQTEVDYQSLEKYDVPSSGPLADSKSNQVDEGISVELHNLHFGTNTIIRPSSPMVDALTADVNCTAEAITSRDFDLAAYSLIGVGSWIEYETHDPWPLDVEVPGDICLTEDHLKGPEGQKQQTTFITCHGNSAAGSSSQKYSGANSSNSGSGEPNQSLPNGGGPHKHPSDDSNGAGKDDDPTQSKKAKTESGTNKRFICPFHVKDPVYFNTSNEHGQKYTLCANGIGFPDIARLKEHLIRVHSPEIICPRCGTIFKKQQDLDLHLDLRNKDGPKCDVRKLPTTRSMTPDMRAQLSNRGKRLSQEEQWFKIYQMLFPNDPRPTILPYRHDFDQPPTPTLDKQLNIPPNESDLPRLYERRVETQLGQLVPDPNCREQIMKMMMSELVFCINQLSVDSAQMPNTFDESQVQKHRQSAVSSVDSAYGSRCGHTDCMGNCNTSVQAVPVTSELHGYAQPLYSPFLNSEEQYLDPSVLIAAQPTDHLQWIEDMEDLRDYEISRPYSDNPYLDDS